MNYLKYLTTLFVLLITCPAMSADEYYEIELDVPTDNIGAGKVYNDMVVPPRDTGGLIENATPEVIASDWAPLVCELKQGWLVVRLTMHGGSSWPSIPSGNKATCSKTVGSTTYYLDVQLNAVTVDYANGDITNWSNGAAFDLPSTKEGVHWYVLPTWSNGYKLEKTAARLDAGGAWTGVWCNVRENENGYPFLFISIKKAADADEGYCRLKKLNLPFAPIIMDVPVSLTGSGR